MVDGKVTLIALDFDGATDVANFISVSQAGGISFFLPRPPTEFHARIHFDATQKVKEELGFSGNVDSTLWVEGWAVQNAAGANAGFPWDLSFSSGSDLGIDLKDIPLHFDAYMAYVNTSANPKLALPAAVAGVGFETTGAHAFTLVAKIEADGLRRHAVSKASSNTLQTTGIGKVLVSFGSDNRLVATDLYSIKFTLAIAEGAIHAALSLKFLPGGGLTFVHAGTEVGAVSESDAMVLTASVDFTAGDIDAHLGAPGGYEFYVAHDGSKMLDLKSLRDLEAELGLLQDNSLASFHVTAEFLPGEGQVDILHGAFTGTKVNQLEVRVNLADMKAEKLLNLKVQWELSLGGDLGFKLWNISIGAKHPTSDLDTCGVWWDSTQLAGRSVSHMGTEPCYSAGWQNYTGVVVGPLPPTVEPPVDALAAVA
jgi:hypothetical protein